MGYGELRPITILTTRIAKSDGEDESFWTYLPANFAIDHLNIMFVSYFPEERRN